MQLLWGDGEVTQDNKWNAIIRGAAPECVHLIKEVMERIRRVTDLHKVEFDRKYDRDSVEFKSRSGKVVMVKDLVGEEDEEASSSSSTCFSQGV